jgi:hypothetical protein
MMLAGLVAVVSPSSGMGQQSSPHGNQHGIAFVGLSTGGEAEFPEMRASIIDRDGDEFIAQTEEGHEFRLPVEGAPADVSVGDSLRLIPDAATQTIQVFKADPTEDGSGPAPGVQL